MCISERSNSQAVLRIQLSLEEFAANVLDLGQLEKTSSWKQRLNIRLLNYDVRSVAEIDQQFHRILVDVPDGHLGLTRLFQLACEHRAEVWRACREYHAMCEDLSTAHVEHDVAQLAMSPQNIELGERDLRMLLGDVRHPSWRAVAVQQDVHPFNRVID